MKKFFGVLLCALFTLCALLMVGCTPKEAPPVVASSKLTTPVVTIDEYGFARWQAVEGAVAYEYKINDGKAVKLEAGETAIKIVGSEKIVVRALAQNASFHSDWSAEAGMAQRPQLPKPTLNVSKYGDVVFVTWEKDARAVSYVYRLNNDAEKPIGADEIGLQIGTQDTLYVKAVGDGEDYLDSDWAIVKPDA